jgi:hypothetical protein
MSDRLVAHNRRCRLIDHPPIILKDRFVDALTTRLAAIATRIQTPLGIAGLALVILYAIGRQILQMKIFDNLGASNTFLVVEGLLQKLFYLALISLFLGVATYIANIYLQSRLPRRRSKLELINAELDKTSSDYVADPGAGRTTVIRHKTKASGGQNRDNR